MFAMIHDKHGNNHSKWKFLNFTIKIHFFVNDPKKQSYFRSLFTVWVMKKIPLPTSR